MSNWGNNFIIGLITPPLIASTRGFGAYTFFAFWCGVGFLWSYFFVPETKGRSLEDMDHVFGDRAAVSDKERRAEILSGLKRTDKEGGTTASEIAPDIGDSGKKGA